MRKYNKNGSLNKVVCNSCGHEAACSRGILKEDFFSACVDWGYFSVHDGETHQWDLCQDCYEKLVKSFKIKPDVSKRTELMSERG